MARDEQRAGGSGTAGFRRGGGPRRLAGMLGRALDAAARRRGFAEAGVLADWAAIVGPHLAGRCQPVKLTFARGRQGGGVLHLHVGGAAALELQHCAPLIVERINGYFGYPAVAELRLVQAPPLPAGRPPATGPAPRSLSAGEVAAVARAVDGVADDGLREALAGLGRTLKAASPAAEDGEEG